MAQPLFDGTTSLFVNLTESCPIVPGATVSRALVNLPEGKVVVFSMDAGQEISEHRAPYAAVVQVTEGLLRFGVGGGGSGETREMRAHDCVMMPPNAPHRLEALEPTRFILTMLKKPGG